MSTEEDNDHEEVSLEKLHAALGVIQNLRGVDPELKFNLDNAKMRGFDLSGLDFTATTMRGADVSYANLHGADLSGVDIANAAFVEADLTNARLAGVRGYRANFFGARLTKVLAQNANLMSANFMGAGAWGADFSHANLRAVPLVLSILMIVSSEMQILNLPSYRVRRLLAQIFRGRPLGPRSYRG